MQHFSFSFMYFLLPLWLFDQWIIFFLFQNGFFFFFLVMTILSILICFRIFIGLPLPDTEFFFTGLSVYLLIKNSQQQQNKIFLKGFQKIDNRRVEKILRKSWALQTEKRGFTATSWWEETGEVFTDKCPPHTGKTEIILYKYPMKESPIVCITIFLKEWPMVDN